MISLVDVLQYTILINLVLAVFNMIPIPPLDGSITGIPIAGSSSVFIYEIGAIWLVNYYVFGFFDVLSIVLYATVPPLMKIILGI